MNFIESLMKFAEYIMTNWNQILTLLLEHLQLTFLSVGCAILIGVPLGILVCYVKKLHKPILNTANVIQAIPSMALLGFAIPLLGIGTVPAVAAVILYSLLPIIKNTYTGISNINPQTIEAAKGIGLTKFQILTKVQIPLALPVIMAGVRISSVTAVGLMTIAAFIGAGGLGFLVFSGIRTMNPYQILAGAIPACLLALTVDYVVANIEKLVTPISLQKVNNLSKESLLKSRKRQKLVVGASTLAVVCLMTTTAFGNMKTADKSISIGSKDYTEQSIIASMVAELIEAKTDIEVKRNLDLGGTQICFTALNSGDIDMYIEYSGTAYGDTLKYPPISDMNQVYETVKKDFKDQFDIEVLNQMGFNNTYALAVTQETAEKYNLKTISDLAKVGSQLTAGTSLEFLNRGDGLPGIEKIYGFKFKKSIGIDGSPKYTALVNKETEVTDAFSTDGLLKKLNLVVLEDDKNFFPPYYAIPIIRSETLEKYPEIKPLVEDLGTHLTNEIMMELNYRVDELQEKPEDVAKDFLMSIGLI